LIPAYGIVGAAFATMIARFIYNLISWAYVYFKFKMQPFTWNYFSLLLIGLTAYLAASFIPSFNWFIWEIIVQSSVFCLLYISLLYFSGFSEDISQTIKKTVEWFQPSV